MNRRQFLKTAIASVAATQIAQAIPDPDEELWLFRDAANAGVTRDEIVAATECLASPAQVVVTYGGDASIGQMVYLDTKTWKVVPCEQGDIPVGIVVSSNEGGRVEVMTTGRVRL